MIPSVVNMMRKFSDRTVGILALQGDYERHQRQLEAVGAKCRLVRLPQDLKDIDSIIIPGGESTTMDILLDRFKLREPLTKFAQSAPVFGTCAGMVMLAHGIKDNLSKVTPLGLLDIDVIRNGYGRQVHSFEDTVTADLGDGEITVDATFIRAPKITRLGSEVTVLASYLGDPVLVRQDNLLSSSFHAELSDDTRLLEYFLGKVAAYKSGSTCSTNA